MVKEPNSETGVARTDKAREIELKLEILPADVNRLRNAPWMKAMQNGRAATKSLNATYYDTPDRKLWKSGLSLRVRKEGRRHVQCVKARENGKAGAFARFEWESFVPGAAPDQMEIMANPALRALLESEDGVQALEPVFETLIKRTSRKLAPQDGCVVSCDMDVGEIKAAERSQPVHELELELKSGDPKQLFEVAKLVLSTVPARLSTLSKGDRGYALASGGGAQWKKAGAVVHGVGATSEEVLSASVASCLDHMVANEDCVLNRAHVEGVHQMRVAGRRLRSTLSIYKTLLPPEQHARLNDHGRAVISALGPARDWDVFIDEVLTPLIDQNPDYADLQKLAAKAEEFRKAGYERADAMLRSREYAEFLLEIGSWHHGREWRDQALTETSAMLFGPARGLARIILAKRHKKIAKAATRVKHMPVPERHEFRIVVKKQRYAAEFFFSLYPGKQSKRYVSGLAGLQDCLGRLNDIAVAETLLDELTASAKGADADALNRAAGFVLGWHNGLLGDNLGELNRNWRKFAAAGKFWEE